MSDDIDIASEREEIARSAMISICEREASKPIPTSEFCLNCDDPTFDGRRWCSAECRNDYERSQ